MARESGGLAAFLSPGDDFDRQAKAFRRKLTRPAMSQLDLQFAGVEVYDVEPQQLPDLYHGSPVRIYGRYRAAGSLAATLSAEVLGKPVEEKFNAELPEADDANPEIERAWASHRVQRLMDEDRRSGSTGALRGPIVELCENYSIVSEYASFIVLENDAEYQRWAIEQKNVVRIGRDRSALEARREALRLRREKAVAAIGPEAAVDKSLATNTATDDSTLNAAGQPAAPKQEARRIAESTPRRSSQNFNFGKGNGGGGGGAIDPVSGMALLSFAGLAAWSARRRSRGGATQSAHAAA
jgi:Ca-activated chloride channel family protein